MQMLKETIFNQPSYKTSTGVFLSLSYLGATRIAITPSKPVKPQLLVSLRRVGHVKPQHVRVSDRDMTVTGAAGSPFLPVHSTASRVAEAVGVWPCLSASCHSDQRL